MKTKVLDISEFWDENNEKPEVTIKKLGFGEQNDIIDTIANVSVKNKKDVEIRPQYGLMKSLTLLKCIVKAPFPITSEYINKELDSDLGDFIFQEIDNFNTLKRDTKKSLEVVGKV